MPSATVTTEPGLSLKKLQLIVQQQEGIFGPLKHIGIGNGKNLLEFEVRTSPRVRAVLMRAGRVPPAAKKGYVLVCHGDCLVSGRQTRVAAFRAASR